MRTLVEVLSFLADHWSLEKRCLEVRTAVSRQNCQRLETLIKAEPDPTKKLLLQAESDRVNKKWDEAGAAYTKWDHWFSKAVDWCALHTSVGSHFIHRLAIAGFDASRLTPEQKYLRPELPKLVKKLLDLPPATWQTTGWAKSVLTAQPKSDDRGQGGKVDDGKSSVPVPKAEATEVSANDRSAGDETQATPAPSLEVADDVLSNAVAAARGAYEWAISKIDGADGMTIAELFVAIQSHPEMTSEYLDHLPDNADTFGTYLRRAGIRRYNTSGSRVRRPSRHPRT